MVDFYVLVGATVKTRFEIAYVSNLPATHAHTRTHCAQEKVILQPSIMCVRAVSAVYVCSKKKKVIFVKFPLQQYFIVQLSTGASRSLLIIITKASAKSSPTGQQPLFFVAPTLYVQDALEHEGCTYFGLSFF